MRRLVFLVSILVLVPLLSLHSYALEYTFVPDNDNRIAEDELKELLEKLPDDIRDKIVTPTADSAEKMISAYDYSFFTDLLRETMQTELPSHLNRLSVSIGMLILVSLIKKTQQCLSSSEMESVVNLCTCLASAMAILAFHKSALDATGAFLKGLSDTMLMIVPVMEAINLAGGSVTLAAVSSTGLNLMIAFSESLFSRVLSPAISVCFILSVVSAVTGNKGIAFMSATVKGLVTTALILIMSLMTMSLTLQTSASNAVDTFTSRAVRFALGSYIPIIGGAVSDSFSLLKSSVSLIRQLSGVTAIVILILVCLGPFLSLLFSRFSVYIATNAAGLLECEAEQSLYSEIGGCYTLMIAVTLSAIIMFIIAISQFCRVTGGI